MSVALELVRAREAGVQAARDGQLRMTCPYPPTSEDARDRVLFMAWISGYRSVVPTPVDYTS